MPLEYKWNHCPSRRNLVCSKLFSIPPARAQGSCTQIRQHKDGAAKSRPVEESTLRRRNKGNGDVDEALAGVVRTDEKLKQALVGQTVLLQRSQLGVALMLLRPRPKVDCHGRWHARSENLCNKARLPRLQNSLCNTTKSASACRTLSGQNSPYKQIRKSLTRSLNPNTSTHNCIKCQPKPPMHNPHWRPRSRLGSNKTLNQPPKTLQHQQKPSHKHPSELLFLLSSNPLRDRRRRRRISSSNLPLGQSTHNSTLCCKLPRPKRRPRHRHKVKMPEPRMRHLANTGDLARQGYHDTGIGLGLGFCFRFPARAVVHKRAADGTRKSLESYDATGCCEEEKLEPLRGRLRLCIFF